MEERDHAQDDEDNVNNLILSSNAEWTLATRKDSATTPQPRPLVSIIPRWSWGVSSSSSSVTVMDEFPSEVAASVGPTSSTGALNCSKAEEIISRLQATPTDRHSLVKGIMTASEAEGPDSWDDTAWDLPKKRLRSGTTDDHPILDHHSKVRILEVIDARLPLHRRPTDRQLSLDVHNRVAIPRHDSAQWHIWNRLRQRSSHHKTRLPLSSTHILYRWLRVRLAAGLIRSSLAFLHQTIENKYQEAKVLLRGLKNDASDPQKYLVPLMELREQLADIWCVYAHFTLDVGKVALDSSAKVPTQKAMFFHGEVSCNVTATTRSTEGASTSTEEMLDDDGVGICNSSCLTLRKVTLESDREVEDVDSIQPPTRSRRSSEADEVPAENVKTGPEGRTFSATLPNDAAGNRNDNITVVLDSDESPSTIAFASHLRDDGANATHIATTNSTSVLPSNYPDECSDRGSTTWTGSFMSVLDKTTQDLLLHLGIRTPEEFLGRSVKVLCQDFADFRAQQGVFCNVRSGEKMISRNKARLRMWLDANEGVKVGWGRSENFSTTLRQPMCTCTQDAREHDENLCHLHEIFGSPKTINELVSRASTVQDLVDHAISILFAARDCPLVGNHTLIAVNLGRIIVSAAAIEEADVPPAGITLSKNGLTPKINAAIATCWDSVDRCHGVKGSDDRYTPSIPSTKQNMELAADFDFKGRKLQNEKRISNHSMQFAMQSVLDLPKSLREATTYGQMIFNDRNTIRALCTELNKWSRLKESLESNAEFKLKLCRSRETSSIVSDDLPLFGSLECHMAPANQVV
jgi:hypothetical protein